MVEPGRVSTAVVITIDRMLLHYIQSNVRSKYSFHLQAGTWETGELRNWSEVYPQLGKIIAYLASSLPKRIMGKAVVGLDRFNGRLWHIGAGR